jgi:DNA-binding transcriptional ArsR family regulator
MNAGTPEIGHDAHLQPDHCTPMEGLPPEALEQVASYFRALSEPTRLRILNLLRSGERNVGELAELTGYTAANVSRHLSFLTRQGLVRRDARGTAAYYSIADASVYALCDLVCGSIARQHERTAQHGRLFAGVVPPATPRRRKSAA